MGRNPLDEHLLSRWAKESPRAFWGSTFGGLLALIAKAGTAWNHGHTAGITEGRKEAYAACAAVEARVAPLTDGEMDWLKEDLQRADSPRIGFTWETGSVASYNLMRSIERCFKQAGWQNRGLAVDAHHMEGRRGPCSGASSPDCTAPSSAGSVRGAGLQGNSTHHG